MTKAEEALVELAWRAGVYIDVIAKVAGINKLVVEQHLRHVTREKKR